MSRNNGFVAGLLLGAVAGFAAKYLVDNKEQVKSVIDEKSRAVLEGVGDLTDYAKEKLGPAAESISRTAGEYINYAKEQFDDFKSNLTADFEDIKEEAEEKLEEKTEAPEARTAEA
ncbi:MAG: hypothetical protein IKE37_06690 [Firmicutes bacterium]|nr:hypothetical protein [Bacillota bacterium]